VVNWKAKRGSEGKEKLGEEGWLARPKKGEEVNRLIRGSLASSRKLSLEVAKEQFLRAAKRSKQMKVGPTETQGRDHPCRRFAMALHLPHH